MGMQGEEWVVEFVIHNIQLPMPAISQSHLCTFGVTGRHCQTTACHRRDSTSTMNFNS
jgi:hypothetical protein